MKFRGNTIKESQGPVKTKADMLNISNDTGKEKASYVVFDARSEARLMKIEENIEKVEKTVRYIQKMLKTKPTNSRSDLS